MSEDVLHRKYVMKPKPTPWQYQERSDAYTHIVRAADNQFVCQMSQDTSGIAEAEARLIAAAPDMLAALKGYLAAQPQCECSDHSGCAMAAARMNVRAVIAKAEGAKP